jgi:hypothetical protein
MILFSRSRKGSWNSCVPDVVLGTLLLVLTGPVIEAIIVEKDISLLWYNFTTCGHSGQNGPPYEDCKAYYQVHSSSVSPHLLPPILPYRGIQLFKLPRIGTYTIVASGGGGGAGVCGSQPGASPVLEISQTVFDRDILEITVGHRGTHACESVRGSKFCNSSIPDEQCSNNWKNEIAPVPQGNGGGGGGGGTLVRQRRNGDYSYSFPDHIVLLVGGGGGATSVMNSSSDDGINGTSEVENGTAGPGEAMGSGEYKAGPGGGAVKNHNTTTLQCHGKSFEDTLLYAVGGTDLFQPGNDVLSVNTHGGFGGGGCGSASGGGGGGYRGGDTRNDNSFHYPGNGGSSHYSTPVGPVNLLEWNYQNGFVRIRHEKCGCAHNCTVDSNRSVFWCTCPENTTLSPDGYDCHREETVTLSTDANPVKTMNLTTFGSVQFYSINTTVANKMNNCLQQLLSIKADVSVEGSTHPTSTGVSTSKESCGVLVLSRSLEIVASINLFLNGSLRNGQKERFPHSLLSRVNTVYRGGSSYDYSIDPPIEVLNASVELHSMMLYQTSGLRCSIVEMSVNSSVEELYNVSSPSSMVPSDVNLTNYFAALLSLVPPSPTPTSTLSTPPTNPTSDTLPFYIYILIAALGGVVVITIGLLLVLFLCMVTSRKRRYKRTVQAFKDSQVAMNGGFALSDEELNILRQIQEQNPGMKNRRPTRKASFKRNSRSMSVSINVRDDLHVSMLNTYAELNVPNYGVDLDDIPVDMDFAQVNYARITANDTEWHIPRETLSYMRELGQGEFGKVLLMQGKCICGYEGNLPVAVKTLSHEKMKDINKFMEEVHLMKKFTHPHIVSLLGYCPAESDGAPMMVLELMKYGDLQSFLQSNKPEPNTVPIISHPEFFHFALDVAKALEFLASQSYVHRDIAARNCLVGDRLVVKLADFGLARDIHGKDYYRLAGTAKLPVKWMSPESLLYGQFTQATDVWYASVSSSIILYYYCICCICRM